MLFKHFVVLFSILTLVSSQPPGQNRPGVIVNVIKLFWSSSDNGTVSKFPPIIEFLVQRIQTLNSNYVYEDLSRPPTWDKPVYTLSPAEQLTAYDTVMQSGVTQSMKEQITTTTDRFEYEELEETTERFFEIITENATHATNF